MKKYIKPEMNIVLFEFEDVITISGTLEATGRSLDTMINGNEAANYGSQEISVFD